MYKEVLQHIDGVSVWPIISFFVFFIFFTLVIGYALSADKAFIADMSQKPLEEV